jgi:hypothetical protein
MRAYEPPIKCVAQAEEKSVDYGFKVIEEAVIDGLITIPEK